MLIIYIRRNNAHALQAYNPDSLDPWWSSFYIYFLYTNNRKGVDFSHKTVIIIIKLYNSKDSPSAVLVQDYPAVVMLAIKFLDTASRFNDFEMFFSIASLAKLRVPPILSLR